VNSPTLFDATIDGGPPMARRTDPVTSVAAAQAVTPGNGYLILKIRYVASYYGPVTAFDIVNIIGTKRWDEGTIRSAVSRAGLTVVGEGRSPRGRRCLTYGCPDG
jgi:hypothetical protein